MSKLIIEEPPLQVLPKLAQTIGLNEAIVLQQLHYLLRQPEFGRKIAEHQWIFNTYEEWQCRFFPFWSAVTIKRAFAGLAKKKLIVFCQPEGRTSRRKYYRIDTEELERLSERIKLIPSNGSKRSDGEDQDDPFLCTKTTSETTVQRKVKGALHSQRHHVVFYPRYPYPDSEESMYETLEHNGIETSPDYDGDFFNDMERKNWTIRGKPVFDWVETYRRRLEKTSPGGF